MPLIPMRFCWIMPPRMAMVWQRLTSITWSRFRRLWKRRWRPILRNRASQPRCRKYSNDAYLRHLMLAAAELHPNIPIAMHQDHGNSPETCASAIEQGFTSVMMDGSLMEDGKTPASYEYNVDVTRKVVELAHAKGVSVEGELGCLGSLETGMGDKEDGHGFEGKLDRSMLLTDPDQARDFVEQTGVDALAVAIGTSHGAYKFTKKPTGEVLAMSRIEEIHQKLPNTHLVMHGSSSVPEELVDLINQFGGAIKKAYGVPVEEIQRGIKHGVRKINVIPTTAGNDWRHS